MGFDLHGMKPNLKSPKPKISMVKATQKEWKKYHEWEEENVGVYFRNNVWSWRPLWDFVYSVCHDILTEEDVQHGHSNSGHKISAKKANRIADKLYSMLNNGQVEEYEKTYKEKLSKLHEKDWDRSYPFDKDNVRRFADFCANSGGFEIC